MGFVKIPVACPYCCRKVLEIVYDMNVSKTATCPGCGRKLRVQYTKGSNRPTVG